MKYKEILNMLERLVKQGKISTKDGMFGTDYIITDQYGLVYCMSNIEYAIEKTFTAMRKRLFGWEEMDVDDLITIIEHL